VFHKVLVANRGEIALRVIRACHELGVKAVAVYSEADSRAPHVREADEAICIGPPPSNQSYLVGDKIIEAAKATGAQAIHPGYGFLSEREWFARAVRDAGLVWIGPPAEAIAAMGSKTAARTLAVKHDVPVVPGTTEPLRDAAEAAKIAKKFGYPILLKAAAGGGGKGMRVAKDADEFERSFQLARSEALSAFGNGDVYVEKYLMRPRHIEFQIMGDKFGHVIHLGERDCSVQRRHQKLIEEAPSPAMTPELRKKMGDAAVAGAKAINYVGAGTIEMLLDEDGSYYFMEMNTRIQVEHPVTEMLTGVDLVKEQIRVAAGLPLSVRELPPLRGHVIECRVNAEDPNRNFQPSPGKIVTFHPPGGNGVRLDTHVYAGYTVPPYYDSMIAKVICQGRDREEALAKMRLALETFIIEGPTTTIPFLARVMQNPRFQSGDVDTKFLEREPDLMKEPG
jgi:acetyl-CoA carboxylase, biotin carboxylase subunit